MCLNQIRRFCPPHLLSGIEALLLETEALYFVEVCSGLEGDNIVRGYAVNGPAEKS